MTSYADPRKLFPQGQHGNPQTYMIFACIPPTARVQCVAALLPFYKRITYARHSRTLPVCLAFTIFSQQTRDNQPMLAHHQSNIRFTSCVGGDSSSVLVSLGSAVIRHGRCKLRLRPAPFPLIDIKEAKRVSDGSQMQVAWCRQQQSSQQTRKL